MSKTPSRPPHNTPPRFGGDSSKRWYILPSEESDPPKIERALRERIKELNCLYGITRLTESGPDSLEEFLQRVVNILPPSWQYPEITCARITFQGQIYKTEGSRSPSGDRPPGLRCSATPLGRSRCSTRSSAPPCTKARF